MSAHETTLVRHPLRPRIATVARVTRLSPHMVRVTLGGIEGFAHAAPTDHVKLVFPVDGQTEPALPEPGRLSGDAPIRDYTVRHHRPDKGELDIDFALPGGVGKGPASSWAAQAGPGQRIGVLGPRGSHVNSYDFDWYLLAGDETALPAIGGWLDAIPDTAPVTVLAEVAGPEAELTLSRDVTWLHRERGESIEAAVAEFVRPAGDGYVWIAGEATALRPVRQIVREWGLPRAWVHVDGYWKRGVANHDHHASDDE